MVRGLAVAGRDDKLAVQEVSVTEPGPGQVRVAVEAASVNGIDAAVAAGYMWDMLPHSFPVLLGRDVAGTVEAVGDGVTTPRVGDRVAGVVTAMTLFTGTIAERITVDAALLTAVPSGVPSEQAAAAGLAAVTARDLVDALSLGADDTVLVSGATGGVGVFAVQLAAATGATVVATARPGGAADLVRDLGAAHTVDYPTGLDVAVRAAAPAGVTAVVHAAGDAATVAALLRPGGRLASALGATAEQTGRTDITVTPVLAVATPEKVAALLDAVAAGTLRVPVTRTYPLDRAADAVTDFGGSKLGKLVITTG